MVLCIIGLFIFGILGIFSAKYRRLAGESFKCALRIATLRPCESSLDQKGKAMITSSIMKISPYFARIIYKNFTVLSWAFVALFIFSTAATGWGLYNYIAFGNCNGPSQEGFCPFSEIGREKTDISSISLEGKPFKGNQSAKINIIEFACYQCPYSKKAEPTIKQVLKEYPETKLTLLFFPLPQHKNGQLAARAGICANKQESFWKMHDAMFENQDMFNNSVNQTEALEAILELASRSGMDKDLFAECINSEEASRIVVEDYENGKKLNLKGTPTFFINGKRLTGPQTFSTFKNEIERSSRP